MQTPPACRRRFSVAALLLRALLPMLLLGWSKPCVAASDSGFEPGGTTTTHLEGEVPAAGPLRAGDGVYGRFDGDLTFTLGLGAELGGGERAAVLGRALYYHSLGVVIDYADALGSDADVRRTLFVGTEIRPLFLPRWSLDLEQAGPLLDLTLDSLSVGFGAYFGELRGEEFAERSGFEAALGFGVPLLARAQGPWLEARGAWRPSLNRTATSLLLLLSVYGSVMSPLVK